MAVPSARFGYGIYNDQPLVGIFEQNAFTNPATSTPSACRTRRRRIRAAGTAPGTARLCASDRDQRSVQDTAYAAVEHRIPAAAVPPRRDRRQLRRRARRPPDAADRHQPAAAGGRRRSGRPQRRPPLSRVRGHQPPSDDGEQPLLGDALAVPPRRRPSRHLHGQLHAEPRARDRDQRPRRGRPSAESAGSGSGIRRSADGSPSHLSRHLRHELPFPESPTTQSCDCLGGWQLSGITNVAVRASDPAHTGQHEFVTARQPRQRGRRSAGGQTWTSRSGSIRRRTGLRRTGHTGRRRGRRSGSRADQTDLALSKNFYGWGKRLQFRADAINAFNHTQWSTVNADCSAAPVAATNCAFANSTVGQITARDCRENSS